MLSPINGFSFQFFLVFLMFYDFDVLDIFEHSIIHEGGTYHRPFRVSSLHFFSPCINLFKYVLFFLVPLGNPFVLPEIVLGIQKMDRFLLLWVRLGSSVSKVNTLLVNSCWSRFLFEGIIPDQNSFPFYHKFWNTAFFKANSVALQMCCGWKGILKTRTHIHHQGQDFSIL